MNTTIDSVATLSGEELRALVDLMVEDKLTSMLGDSEDELEIRDDLRDRLIRQRVEMRKGERSVSFEDAMIRLGLA